MRIEINNPISIDLGNGGARIEHPRSQSLYRVLRPIFASLPLSPPGRIRDEPVVASPGPSHFESVHFPPAHAQHLSQLFAMAPYHFDSPDADLIVRSSDGKEFRVHQFILKFASPFFRAALSSPQPKAKIRKVDIPYSSDVLQPFLQYLYPRSPPKITDISTWAALYAIADKYGAEVVKDLLRDMLIPRFLKKSPLRVYAVASYWGFDEEARIASRRTLKTVDILTRFPQEDARIMGAAARQRLHRLHSSRRDAARALVNNHPRPSPSHLSCKCPPPAYANLRPALCQSMATRPWLTIEDVYRVDSGFSYPKTCAARSDCRHSAKNIHAYFCSLVRKISKLPQTV